MTFEVVFLESDVPLTKTYERKTDGSITKSSYPNAYLFTSTPEQITTLADFEKHLKTHAAAGRCLLKGTITEPLRNESRAGSTNSLDPTHWVCLDIDGLPPKHKLDTLLTMLGLGDVSYVLQWSASYLIPATEKDLRCHIFMLLDKPASPDTLKEWLRGLNLNTTFLRENTSLTKGRNTLHWGLDVTACQNDKLLYITEPKLINIPNPFTKAKPRITLVKKAKQYLTLGAVPLPQDNKDGQHERVLELCDTLGIKPPKPAIYKAINSEDVVQNPTEATLTGVKEARGYVYLNINGGDSWGYWHFANNADVIYNFKGEDPVLTKKFLPKYYGPAAAKAKALVKEEAAEHNVGMHEATKRDADNNMVATPITLLAFQDKSGNYWVGRYNADTDKLDINKKKSEKQVRDFCAENAMPIGDFVPEWNIVFDPQSEVRVDQAKRTINMYQPSPYLLAPMKIKVTAPPPLIFKVIHHALGCDNDITEHFINWLAFIVQRRDRTGTAWVMYGTEGTGKGVLFNHILTPLLGEAQTTMNRVEQLSKGFNGFIKNKLLVAFDEVHIAVMKDQDEILGRLRNMISEKTVSIRDLYVSPDPVPNPTNYLFFSNKRDAVLLSTNDRRYNVGKYQHEMLEVRHPEFKLNWENTKALLATELQAFAFYLRSFKMKEQAATKPLESEDRNSLIAATMTAPDQIAERIGLRTANMQALLAELPSDERKEPHARREAMRDYKQTLADIMLRTLARVNSPKRQKDEPNGVMSRDEARKIFEYCAGVGSKEGATRFTQYLRHRHLEPVRVWIDDKTTTGLKQNWQDVEMFPQYLSQLGYKEKA